MNNLLNWLITIYVFGQLYLSWYLGYNGHPYYYILIMTVILTALVQPITKRHRGYTPSWGPEAYVIIFLVLTFVYTLPFFAGQLIGPNDFIFDIEKSV
ncbi:MAG: hypothetical protein CMD90_03700 [Gammaproteobacteria bacterium]|nr:hypothetical protein [Gammaproteobacteria bacterium]